MIDSDLEYRFNNVLKKIVQSDELHAKWLNTLSYLENCGARKISACEHPTLVKEIMLKHASEEFRHAHYLKRQISRIFENTLSDYSSFNLLGGYASRNYLNALDLSTCRFLNQMGISSKKQVKEYAYILVTYAIELRAQQLYPLYDLQLKENKSKVTVRSILLEEEEHLHVMCQELEQLSSGLIYATKIRIIEENLCLNWLQSLEHSILQFQTLKSI